jgi:cell division initiation protein
MKLTPLDIRHKEFKRGMRGYVDGEVDEFLDEVADEFERLFKENIELSERGEALQEKIEQYRNLEETLQHTLVAAQRSAEELKANAQKEAQLMLSEAELKARQMVNESYADKQSVEKQIVVLRSSEEDFRFKFRSLLEGYVEQLTEIDAESKKAGRFATDGEQIKDAMTRDAASRAGAPPAAKPPVATAPLAARPPAAAPAAQTPPAAPVTPPPQPAHAPAPTGPPPSTEAPRPAASPTRAADNESTDAPRPAAPPTPAADKASADPRAPFLGEPDDLLADVESEVDDNAFKW